MHKLSADEHTALPLGAEVIRRDFYVDDLISGAKSKEEAKSKIRQISLLKVKGRPLENTHCAQVGTLYCAFMDPIRALEIQCFCSKPSSCHLRANLVSGEAICSNFFKSS